MTQRVADVVPICLLLPPHEIAYVKFVFESYDGVAVVRTLERHAARLVVLAAPDFEAAARAVVRSLVEEGACAETGPPPGFDGDWLGPEEGDRPRAEGGVEPLRKGARPPCRQRY